MLVKQAQLQVGLRDKIALSGLNDYGKQTLLQAILFCNENIEIYPRVKIRFFTQLAYQNLPNETVWHFIKAHRL